MVQAMVELVPLATFMVKLAKYKAIPAAAWVVEAAAGGWEACRPAVGMI